MKMELQTDLRKTSSQPQLTGTRFRSVLPVLALITIVLGAALGLGYWPRALLTRQLASSAQANQNSLPSATVIPVRQAPGEVEISLPGNIQAITETPIFARADGYIMRRLADIGDRVEAGQLLAEIDSPELDQQVREAQAALKRSQSALQQAEAALVQSRANMNLAEVTAKRWQTLVHEGILSKQEGDEKLAVLEARTADVAAAEANVQAARETISASEASLHRLLELQSFRQVRAPFAGVVTARNVDVGMLVSVGSSSSIREMFRVAQIHTLRIFVSVPQSEALAVQPGLACTVVVAEYRERQFRGKVTRTANSLDAASRTLLTEIQVPNQDGALLPGMYATVKLVLRRTEPPLMIPSSAYRNNDKGPVVAILREDSTVHFVPVKLGRDYGPEIEVLEGLRAGQKVITNLIDEVREGSKVQPLAPAKPAARDGGSTR